MSTAWHVSRPVVELYATGGLDHAAEASVEMHLTRCGTCREVVTALYPAPDVEELWDGVRAEIAAPADPWLVRLLRRLGLPDADAVILTASPALRLPWILAVFGALVFTAVAASMSARRGELLYVVVAPLLPALGVAAAYDTTDPIRGIVDTTAFSKLRITLLRTAIVAAASIPPALLLGLVVPDLGPLAFAWLLPALAMTLVSLALLTWFNARVTATAVGVGWIILAMALAGPGPADLAWQPPMQLAYALIAVAACAVLVVRLDITGSRGGSA
jgi:hypothetical protein